MPVSVYNGDYTHTYMNIIWQVYNRLCFWWVIAAPTVECLSLWHWPCRYRNDRYQTYKMSNTVPSIAIHWNTTDLLQQYDWANEIFRLTDGRVEQLVFASHLRHNNVLSVTDDTQSYCRSMVYIYAINIHVCFLSSIQSLYKYKPSTRILQSLKLLHMFRKNVNSNNPLNKINNIDCFEFDRYTPDFRVSRVGSFILVTNYLQRPIMNEQLNNATRCVSVKSFRSYDKIIVQCNCLVSINVH